MYIFDDKELENVIGGFAILNLSALPHLEENFSEIKALSTGQGEASFVIVPDL